MNVRSPSASPGDEGCAEALQLSPTAPLHSAEQGRRPVCAVEVVVMAGRATQKE